MAKSDKFWHLKLLLLWCGLLLFSTLSYGNSRVPSNISLTQKESYILSDGDKLISDIFEIPPLLKKRVSFWFKIYSKYTIDHSVIHDTDYPWVIYDVVNSNDYRKRGLKNSSLRAKQRAIANAKKREYRAILLRLSKAPSYKSLSGRERRVFHLFDHIPGKRRKLFATAAYRIRRQEGQRDSLIFGLKRSGQYWSRIEKILKKERVPSELITICLLESSFVLHAYSKAGAAGVWQFMRKTGSKLLNYVRSDIDERYDPIKATSAAAKLLKQNYQILKTWPLAVNAYNTGPGILLKAKRQVKSSNIAKVIQKFRARGWGFASQNYYSSFLGALYVTKYYPMLFGDIRRDSPLVHDDEIVIRYPMKVSTLAKLCNVSIKDLKRLNPDLKNSALRSITKLPKNYSLRLPVGHRKYLEEYHQALSKSDEKLAF